MFWTRAEAAPASPAQMVKIKGQWRTLTRGEVAERVRHAALGLLALGYEPGDRVAILSATRAEWVQADLALLSAGCVTVPIYATYTPEQVAHLLIDSDARAVILEDPGQLAKVLEVRGKLDHLERIVVLSGYEGQDASVLTWEALQRLGRDHEPTLGSRLAERVGSTSPQDVASIVYTSGTTGLPKGVVQTHANHLAVLESVARITPVGPGDVHLLFLPLAHAFARLEAFMGIYSGLTTAFAESIHALPDNLREVRPTLLVGVPLIFERAHRRVSAALEASPVKRRVSRWALGVGRAVSERLRARRPVPVWLRWQYTLADRLVFSRIREGLGGRLRFAVSGGAPLPPEVAEFFHAAGILILEGYGLTEACPVLTFNRLERFKFGSVGLPIPGVEMALAPDGEILARGANVAMRGYLGLPEATAATFAPDGWLRTGDIGSVDAEGFVFITDRKKDLIVTSGGLNIAPQAIENLLRRDPLVSQAMVYGDGRPYPVALIAVSGEELTRFARARAILATDHESLTRHPEVLDRVGRIVEGTNAELPPYARLRRFAVLPSELREEAGELTPTQKVRRKAVADKYRTLLESLYA